MLVLSGLDQTILSTALPRIVSALQGRDLAPWVFSAYLLASTAVIPLYGKLADRFGVRPLLLTAAAIFVLGSLACAAATDMRLLVGARALQGLGGGGLMTLTMLAVAALYPASERARRMGLLGAAYGISTLVGPLVGGMLLEAASWQWAFLINLPGSLLALIVLSQAPFGAPPRPRHKLVPLTLFRIPTFAIAAALSLSSGVALFTCVVFLPLYLQQGLGMDAIRSALHMLPLMLGITVGGQVAGRTLRAGLAPRRLAGFAALGLKLGFVLLCWTLQRAHTLDWALSAALLPVGLGLGLLFPLVTLLSQRSAPATHIGTATATPVMLRALGGALGVALLGEVLRQHMAQAALAGLHSQAEATQALAAGVGSVCAWAAGTGVLALLVSRALRAPALAPATATG